MALVDYSDSEDSDVASKPQGSKRKRPSTGCTSTLPPLPDTFHNLYASTTRLSSGDDPTLHGGRQRQTPHVQGHWPTHVYVEWFPSTEENTRLHALVSRMTEAASPGQKGKSEVHSFLRSDLGAELPLHISLSRPMVLRTEQKSPFLRHLTEETRESSVTPFTISTANLEWHANFDETRYFLVLRLERDPKGSLLALLKASNSACARIDQLPLYAKGQMELDADREKGSKAPGAKRVCLRDDELQVGLQGRSEVVRDEDEIVKAFHVSIGWSLQLPAQGSAQRLKEVDVASEIFDIQVESLKVKMGNEVKVISLSEKKSSANGIIEG